jgi:hypothetical protein
MDLDRDDVISYDDFSNGIRNILALRLNQQEMLLYY